MRLKLTGVVRGDAIVEHGIDPAPPQHPLERDTLLDADRSPWHYSSRGLNGPADVRDHIVAEGRPSVRKRSRSHLDGTLERAQPNRDGCPGQGNQRFRE